MRPGSSREAREAAQSEGSSGSSFDSVLLGPDLRPSRATSTSTAAPKRAGGTAAGTGPATPKSVVPAQRKQSPVQQAAAQQQTSGKHPAQSTLPHGSASPLAPLQLESSDDLISNLKDLPANLSERTLIASLDAQVEQQPARDKVQIAAREVDVQLSDPRLIMHLEPDSERAATFRILRHRLVERGHPRTILVTSPRQGDGKTLLATNLSMALSECGRARVLLVEANLRQPDIARTLGFRPPRCFAEQLASHKTKPMEPWMVAQVASPWLHVIAIDPTTFDLPRVIDGPAMEGGLDQLKRVQYDYIVIDTPPVLGSADVNLVQDAADGVLMAAWARRTSTKDLGRAIDQLTPSKILGTVLLDV